MMLIPALAFGADAQWDYPADWDQIVGYTFYYSDGINNYNKSILKADTVSDGSNVTYADIESNLQLGYDITYDIYLTAYDEAGESGPSNTVSFSRSGYSPPADSLPPPVGSVPSDASGLGIE